MHGTNFKAGAGAGLLSLLRSTRGELFFTSSSLLESGTGDGLELGLDCGGGGFLAAFGDGSLTGCLVSSGSLGFSVTVGCVSLVFSATSTSSTTGDTSFGLAT